MNNTTKTPNDNGENKHDFESAMQELEELVAKIETGNLSLEESLQQFEKGIKLSRSCQAALKDAEKRVKILSGDEELDFDVSDSEKSAD